MQKCAKKIIKNMQKIRKDLKKVMHSLETESDYLTFCISPPLYLPA